MSLTCKVPKLRFPEFSGEWEENKLENFCNKIASGKSKQNNDGQYDLYGSTGIIGKTDQYSNDGKYILIARVGANAGLTNIVEGKFGVTDNTLIVDLNNKAEVDFVLPLLHKNNLNKLIFGSGQPLITGGQLKELKLFFPSIDEEQKIASFLSAVDTKINQLTRKKELLEQYKKGVMQKIFSQELRFKDDDGSEFPEWVEKKLGEIVISINNGTSLTQSNDQSGYKVTRIETISDTTINVNKIGYVSTNTDLSSYKLNIGDMLFSNINSVKHIGKIAYVDREYDLYHGMNLLNIRVNNHSTNSKFIYYLLTSKKYKNYFETICNQAVSQASINQTDLKKTKILLPSLKEQTKIANFLSSLDEKLLHVSTQLDATKQFKKALLQQMFV